MSWLIGLNSDAERQLRRIPKDHQRRIMRAIDSMSADPFFGDIQKMEGEKNVWRRRIGAYRIFYEIGMPEKIIKIFKIERRTTSTY